MRIYTCAPTPPVPRPAWASAAGSRATTPPGPIRHSAIGRPMRSTNHRRSRGLLRHRSVWQHDRHYSPQGDRPELRSLSRLSKLGGPAQNTAFGACLRRAPAVNTLRRLLERDDLEAAFRRHADELNGTVQVTGKRTIALDGKALRGSFDHLNDRTAAHVLSAFASDAALILAHQEVAGA